MSVHVYLMHVLPNALWAFFFDVISLMFKKIFVDLVIKDSTPCWGSHICTCCLLWFIKCLWPLFPLLRVGFEAVHAHKLLTQTYLCMLRCMACLAAVMWARLRHMYVCMWVCVRACMGFSSALRNQRYAHQRWRGL